MSTTRAWKRVCLVGLSCAALCGCAQLSDLIDPPKQESEETVPVASQSPPTSEDILQPEEQTTPEVIHSAENTAQTQTTEAGFFLLIDNASAFSQRLEMIEQAKTSIDLQTFVFRDDRAGNRVLTALATAAERGVAVRLLVDDLWLGEQDEKLAAFAAHPKIDVRLFNPLARNHLEQSHYADRFGPAARRMHTKALIVDKKMAILGDRNISVDTFTQLEQAVYKDLEILTAGPAVQTAQQAFDAFWRHALAWSIDTLVQYPPNKALAETLRKNIADSLVEESDGLPLAKAHAGGNPYFAGDTQALFDPPSKILAEKGHGNLVSQALWQQFNNAAQDILIITPHFIPGAEGADLLIGLAQQGLRIRVLTHSLASSSHTTLHAQYAEYRLQLLDAGVEIFELKADEKHLSTEQSFLGKMFVFDQQRVFIGSPRMDPSAWLEHTESGLLLTSAALGNQIASWFDQEAMNLAYQVQLQENARGKKQLVWRDEAGNETNQEPDVSLPKRVINRLYRLFPGESSQ